MKIALCRPMFPVLALCLAAGSILSGCYKTEMETQKARADKAEGDLKAVTEQVAATKSNLDAERARANQAKRGQLVTIVNGQQAGYDEIAMTQPGQFVREGVRQRPGSKVMFTGGRIADQQLVVLRDNGKPNFQGNTRNSRPDGEWIWFDPKGMAANKEVWKDGKLAQVFNATAVKGDAVTWKERTKIEKEAWFKERAAVFNNLPELVRELDANPAPTSAAGRADATKSGAAAGTGTAPAGTTPAKPTKATGKR